MARPPWPLQWDIHQSAGQAGGGDWPQVFVPWLAKVHGSDTRSFLLLSTPPENRFTILSRKNGMNWPKNVLLLKRKGTKLKIAGAIKVLLYKIDAVLENSATAFWTRTPINVADSVV